MPGLYVGIDAGGSGTRAAVAEADGRLLATGEGGASDHLGGAAGRRRLAGALAAALAPIAACVGGRGVAGACVVQLGLRGLSVPGRQAAARQAIAEALPTARVEVVNDAVVALWGALGGGAGVAVLAGTGSIALARAADGHQARAGGYGYLVGDEGSGFWIGREAVAACLRAADGRGPSTQLVDRLCAATRRTTAAELVAWLYAGRERVLKLARLAPLVAATAAEGDAVARGILDRAGTELAELAAAAAAELRAGLPTPLPVACCGGVWAAGDRLRRPFATRLAELLPTAHVVQPCLPPVGGAVLMAIGSRATPAAIERLATELRSAGA